MNAPTISTSNVRSSSSVTSASQPRVTEGAFTGSRALREITSSKDFQANFTLTPPSRSTSNLVAADRGARV